MPVGNMEAAAGLGAPTCNQPILRLLEASVVRGGIEVVHSASLALFRGEMTGLIGPNGAGKSTIIGGILGHHPLRAGSVEVDGTSYGPGEELPPSVRRRFAYVPEQPVYYSDLTLAEHLEWQRRVWVQAGSGRTSRVERGGAIPASAGDPAGTAPGGTGPDGGRALAGPLWTVEELVRRFDLAAHLTKFPHQCSKGTLQKWMLVSALMFPFDILIADEPFIGLDVFAIRTVRELLREAREAGAAVLLSTHVLDFAERMCQRFAFVLDGEVFAAGTLAELQAGCTADGGTRPSQFGQPPSPPADSGLSLEDVFMCQAARRNLAKGGDVP
ncbi:MAG: ABC transporter ATP-binding protein [Alicyclobacillaceae bacterium]|nr:ABC transporter ATP-binding protein [Alicyclobacillaceae bacterium]